MINIAVCDDSKEYVKIVKELIKAIMAKNNIACNIDTYISGLSLVEAYTRKTFDIIFLDMEMPEADGIKTGLLIREISDKTIIFYLTSHKKYAYESYQVKARNYLLKPIQSDVLEKELIECIAELDLPVEFLDVKDIDGIIHRIPLGDITHILRKKDDRKLHIYTLNKQEIIIVQTLKSIEDSLSSISFFKRSGKSCLVNLNNIRAIEKNIIYFTNDETEEASRRCLSDLVKLFKQQNKG
ncbi:MAG: LytTR family DNA-binding domain-containing protein [Tissierellia bacterium]|nr:LytTR family DNA-binding domain-containing protein [Tissierellia bacterium]MDD3226390.1 LytTR family DNA-binding domain-containing protein [Tissierellia bacterium]MDD4046191.1 LytTR family DNA-binding domain-containing protein [Tissierellia bacterium]